MLLRTRTSLTCGQVFPSSMTNDFVANCTEDASQRTRIWMDLCWTRSSTLHQFPQKLIRLHVGN
jgi:hypothetical protein